LAFVCDFDRTFTTDNAPATWGIFMYSWLFWDDFFKESEDLFNKYYPIEIGNYSHEYKTEMMIKWWNEALDVIIKYNITESDIDYIIHNKDLVKFRDWAIDFLKVLYEKDIPIVFFSAGCWDIIERLLRREGLYNHNLFIQSNFLEYNKEWEIIWYKDPDNIIHPENKHTFPLLPEIQEKIKDKQNCVIMWDGPWDTKLEHLVEWKNILKIAVKISSIEKKLLKQAGFDILTKSYDFSWINKLFLK
jgi:HAD superfamily hydrolase (TIGR01544 family)